MTVRLAADDPQSVVMRFFDAEGSTSTRTASARSSGMYHREEFRRVLGARDRGHRLPGPGRRALHRRSRSPSTVAAIDRTAGFKIVLDLSYGSASFVMPNVLAKLDADVLVVNPYAAHAPG